MIYAAVRYPDEIVDSFPLPPAAKYGMLAKWGADYERALKGYSGVSWILAGFAEVVRKHAIPHEHYREFLKAMWRDVEPVPFGDLQDLILNYVYGSAMVVGYFRAHV